MDDWIIRLVDATGYAGVFLLMVVETIFPPIPSEVVMTVAGISASRGAVSLPGIIASGTAGAMLGNYLWYWLALNVGEARLKAFVDRHSRWLTLDWSHVERGEALFRKRGAIIILVARMLPNFRTLISIPAGLFNMSRSKFLLYSMIGAAGWNTALASAGYALGTQFDDVERIVGPVSLAIIGLIIVAYLWRLVTWKPAD